MKNIMKIALVAAVCSLTLSGCLKETFPTDRATAEQVAGSESGLKAMVTAMNAVLTQFDTSKSDSHWDFGYPAACMMRELMGNDFCTYTSSYHQFSLWETNLSMGPDWIASRFTWTYYYQLVYSANLVIKMIDPETATDIQKQYLGLAKTYRALAYLDMVRLYSYKGPETGDFVGLAVPIVDENTTEAMAANNPRATTEAVYAFIVEDLLYAQEALKGYVRTSKNTPDLSVVNGLLARTYLELGEWENAKSAARAAIDGGGYKVLTEAEWTNPTDGFNSIASNSWMWGIIITQEDRVVTTGICNFISMISSETTFGYALANGKDSPQKMIDRKFYESISDTDWRKKSWMGPEGVAGKIRPSSGHTDAWLTANIDIYTQFKFRPKNGEYSDFKIAAAADFPLMRVEEMYLIEAEAAGMLALGDGKSLLENFVKTRQPDYTSSAMSQVQFQEEVYKQKRIELWGEGLVFFDTKRLDKGMNRGYAGTNHYDATRFNTTNVAPWFNICVNTNETMVNKAIINNPNPEGKVPLWVK